MITDDILIDLNLDNIYDIHNLDGEFIASVVILNDLQSNWDMVDEIILFDLYLDKIITFEELEGVEGTLVILPTEKQN